MLFILASCFTSMPCRWAMRHSESPRFTTCTCGRREERPRLSTRAAASTTLAGRVIAAAARADVPPTVKVPVGRPFSSRIDVDRGIELLRDRGNRVALLHRVERGAQALLRRELREVLLEDGGAIGRQQQKMRARPDRWPSDGTPGSARRALRG